MTLRLTADEALIVAAAGDGRAPVPPVTPGRVHGRRLLSLAAWHRMTPLLWQHVQSTSPPAGVPAVPEEVRERLRHAMRESTVRNLSMQIELERALVALADAAIPVVLLKGAALAETVYPEPGLRPMEDLDLLVPKADVRRAHDVIQAVGYVLMGAELARDDDARLEAYHHHFPLVKAGGGAVIEVHQHLFVDRTGYDIDALWARAHPSDAAPAHLLPAPEDLFLHVAAHFTFDRMNRDANALGQVADLVRIADRWSLDWDAIGARAVEYGLVDRVFLALLTLTELFGDVAPATTVDGLRPASYTPELGELFVRTRVLQRGPAIPLEQLSIGGARRVFPGRASLERYVRLDDHEVPSIARLRVRRMTSLAGRVLRELPGPRTLRDDLRLSRWIVSLRE